MRQILLTGGSGFIGKNVLECLPGKYQIFAPGHFELDLLDRQAVARFFSNHSIDTVIHAAGVGASRAEGSPGVFENNKNIFLNLVEHKAKIKRLIFLGSGAEYDKSRPLVKIKETDFGKFEPRDEYGRAKYFVSKKIATLDSAVNLRCFGVFGKYEDYQTRFISNAICRALFDLPIVIRQNVVFDYVYINDLVRIIDYFIANVPKQKFYNAGSGEGVQLLALANIVKSKTGGKAEIIFKNSGLGREYTCDNSLLMDELKDFKFTPFEHSIGELVQWYKKNQDSIDISKLEFDVK